MPNDRQTTIDSRFVDIKDWSQVQVGSIVQGKLSGEGFVVASHQGDEVVLIKTIVAHAPGEWRLLKDR